MFSSFLDCFIMQHFLETFFFFYPFLCWQSNIFLSWSGPERLHHPGHTQIHTNNHRPAHTLIISPQIMFIGDTIVYFLADIRQSAVGLLSVPARTRCTNSHNIHNIYSLAESVWPNLSLFSEKYKLLRQHVFKNHIWVSCSCMITRGYAYVALLFPFFFGVCDWHLEPFIIINAIIVICVCVKNVQLRCINVK